MLAPFAFGVDPDGEFGIGGDRLGQGQQQGGRFAAAQLPAAVFGFPVRIALHLDAVEQGGGNAAAVALRYALDDFRLHLSQVDKDLHFADDAVAVARQSRTLVGQAGIGREVQPQKPAAGFCLELDLEDVLVGAGADAVHGKGAVGALGEQRLAFGGHRLQLGGWWHGLFISQFGQQLGRIGFIWLVVGDDDGAILIAVDWRERRGTQDFLAVDRQQDELIADFAGEIVGLPDALVDGFAQTVPVAAALEHHNVLVAGFGERQGVFVVVGAEGDRSGRRWLGGLGEDRQPHLGRDLGGWLAAVTD